MKDEINTFKAHFNSVCLATLNAKGEVICSYAPIIQTKNGDYLYISELSEHFEGIKTHADNIEVLFVEDESKAASVILRKRLRLKARASIMQRDAQFEQIFDEFEQQNANDEGIKAIRHLLDFHLIKLEYKSGRFVKGFGQAYELLENGEVKHISLKRAN